MVRSRRRGGLAILPALAALGPIGPAIARATPLPPEHECPALSGAAGPAAGAARANDSAPQRVREGMVIAHADVVRLAPLLPVEVWRHRKVFFPDEMRMVIGPCHRRYPQPSSYRRATEQLAARVRLDAAGNLAGYTAGLPFPRDAIDLAAGDAGARWAWNLEHRYRGAGPRGQFRILDLPAEIGGAQSYRGSWFQLQTAQRADLAQADYRATEAEPAAWIAGGRFLEPADARHLAWRQIRPLDVAGQYALPDDVFVYVPGERKIRRAASAWVDGLFMPGYRVTGGDRARAVTEHLPRGFTGLSIRPNAYAWRVLGVREVIAPLNTALAGFPVDPDRDFGPSRLSLASDRWDVREAVVIQGALRARGRAYDWLTLYVDTQTQQPLYVITERRGARRLLEVGILAHRFSDDLPGYPPWPDGERASVFDPVAAVFYDASEGGGWRRESYDVRSTPLDAEELRRVTSDAYLERGH